MGDEPERSRAPPAPHADQRAAARAEARAAAGAHLQILTVVCVLVLAALVYAAAFDLDSVAEWIVFAMIIVTVIGAMIAVHGPAR